MNPLVNFVKIFLNKTAISNLRGIMLNELRYNLITKDLPKILQYMDAHMGGGGEREDGVKVHTP
jgi:hypothetical protein